MESPTKSQETRPVRERKPWNPKVILTYRPRVLETDAKGNPTKVEERNDQDYLLASLRTLAKLGQVEISARGMNAQKAYVIADLCRQYREDLVETSSTREPNKVITPLGGGEPYTTTEVSVTLEVRH